MSLIACTEACVYQDEGYCHLEQAASAGQAGQDGQCVHFVERGGRHIPGKRGARAAQG